MGGWSCAWQSYIDTATALSDMSYIELQSNLIPACRCLFEGHKHKKSTFKGLPHNLLKI